MEEIVLKTPRGTIRDYVDTLLHRQNTLIAKAMRVQQDRDLENILARYSKYQDVVKTRFQGA